MKWRVYLSSVLLVFLSLCFGSFIINQKNSVNALSYTTTWDFDVHPSLYLCGYSSSYNCSDYSYVIFHPLSSCTDSAASFYVAGLGSFNGNSLISVCSDIIAPINTSSVFLTGGTYLSSRYSGNVEITLTDSLVSCPDSPSGSLTITENGTFDVTNYAEAVVDVPPEIQEGDYHDDLVSLRQAIVIVPAVALVIYFLYAIYKMLLGGKTL